MYPEYHNGQYIISTDPERLVLDDIYSYLSRSYWANGRPKELVQKSLKHSLNFGVYDGSRQIGLIRVVTDYTTYAYLCDVYILEEYQGQGLGKWAMSVLMAYPDLQGLRRWSLVTRDAHGLYRQFGFQDLKSPERYMEIINS